MCTEITLLNKNIEKKLTIMVDLLQQLGNNLKWQTHMKTKRIFIQ
jgi:hypothetical protein